jgi:hypothetical protein
MAQQTVFGAYTTAANSLTMARIFVSSPLKAGILLKGGASYRAAIGIEETNINMNLFARYFVYVYRPGTGNVKTIAGPSSCANESPASEAGAVLVMAGAATDFAILAGDRIVIEAWWDIRNTKSVSYTALFYFDGRDDVTDNAAAANAAGYLYAAQTLTPRPIMQARSITSLRFRNRARFHSTLRATRAPP